jgi:hypothetical protein
MGGIFFSGEIYMITDEKLTQLIDHVNQMAPHIEALEKLIVNHRECRIAWAHLVELSAAWAEQINNCRQLDLPLELERRR